MNPNLLRLALVAIVGAASVVAPDARGLRAGSTTTRRASAAVVPQGPTLKDINTVDGLQALFDADKGRFRVVLLLSPT